MQKPRTGLLSQHVCTSFHESVSTLSHVLCHLYLTSMMCAPQHLVFCNTQCGFHYVSLTPQVLSSFLVAYWHTVTGATSPSPFLSIKLLLACCCTKNSLHVPDPNSCATGASQMFPHSLCLFFLLSFLEQNFWIIIKSNGLSPFHQWAAPLT